LSFAKNIPSGFFSSTAYLAHPGGTTSSASDADADADAARGRASRRRHGIARGVATVRRIALVVIICVEK
jgi:hypothetical protein